MQIVFSEEELVAIAKLANAMIAADGKVAEEEMESWTMEMERWGIGREVFPKVFQRSETIDFVDALHTVAHLDGERKVYVAAFIGALMAVDGQVNEGELKLWQLVSIFCDLPTMSVGEALAYMAELSARKA